MWRPRRWYHHFKNAAAFARARGIEKPKSRLEKCVVNSQCVASRRRACHRHKRLREAAAEKSHLRAPSPSRAHRKWHRREIVDRRAGEKLAASSIAQLFAQCTTSVGLLIMARPSSAMPHLLCDIYGPSLIGRRRKRLLSRGMPGHRREAHRQLMAN